MKRFDIYWIKLDPTIGTEIKKTRPCVIISPDEMNDILPRVMIAPLTSTISKYPFRLKITSQKQKGDIVLDQIRTVDKKRLMKFMGRLSKAEQEKLIDILLLMFAA